MSRFWAAVSARGFAFAAVAFSFILILMNVSRSWYDEGLPEESVKSLPEELHDKWIVVTSVLQPTVDIGKLAAISGWKLLVVGDWKTPSNWSFPGTVYIGFEQQKRLGYSIIEHVPYNSYTRKNIGYLYAIQHGARYIYDTDDDNHPSLTDGMLNFPLEPTISGLTYADRSKDVMNPYAHFGQPTIWPRGFPLNKVTQKNNRTYELHDLLTPAIQQGLVNGDPDVDAIYRLINRKQNMTSLSINFDSTAPLLILPNGVFAPFNSQNTLFHYDALWALMLPTSVTFRVTDIWRGYWAQKLLWLIGHRMAFFSPNAVQIRNPHNYFSDFEQELQFYTQADKLVSFLSSWNCGSHRFFFCVNKLSRDMMKEKFWTQKDVDLVEAWLTDLKSIGYQEPNIIQDQKDHINHKLLESISKPKANHSVYFSPALMHQSQSERRFDLLTFCDKNLNNSKEFASKLALGTSYSFPNLLLVILFNFPFYKNIKYLDTLYRDHFPHMLFCSQAKSYEIVIDEMNKSFPKWRERDITFLNISSQRGYYAYECILHIIEMNYEVDGFLVVGDDIMLNTWNLKHMNFKEGYYQIEQRLLLHRNQTFAHVAFPWWTYDNGRKPTNAVLDEIEHLAKSKSDDIRTKAMKMFVANRQKKNMNMTMVSTALSDLYYVPNHRSKLVAEVLKIFLRHGVYTDIAVATTLVAFYDTKDTDDIFSGVSLWSTDRGRALEFFNSSKHYVHPIKFTSLENDQAWRQRYCELYINEMFKNW